MITVECIKTILKNMGIKIEMLPCRRELLEKMLNEKKPYIIMHKDQGRTYYETLFKNFIEVYDRSKRRD